MRIGMVSYEFRPVAAGAERMAEALGRALVARGHEVWVLTGWWRRRDARREDADRWHVIRHATCFNSWGRRPLWRLGQYTYLLSLAWQLARRGRRWQVWQVYQGLSWAAVAVWLGRRWHIPVVVKVTSGPRQFDLDIVRPWLRRTVLQAPQFVCPSQAGHQALLAEGVPAARIAVIPNGVDVEQFRPAAEPAAPVVIFVGRLTAIKGVDVLLRAVARLRAHGAWGDWRLQVVGWGEDAAPLRALAGTLGLDDVVEWLGSRDDVPALLAHASVFVQPSRSEGLSNSLLEAMAAGLACVATDVGGTREAFGCDGTEPSVLAVTEMPTGWLIPPDREDLLADGLRAAMADAGRRWQIGLAARARIEVTFSLERMVDAYECVYQRLVGDAA